MVLRGHKQYDYIDRHDGITICRKGIEIILPYYSLNGSYVCGFMGYGVSGRGPWKKGGSFRDTFDIPFQTLNKSDHNLLWRHPPPILIPSPLLSSDGPHFTRWAPRPQRISCRLILSLEFNLFFSSLAGDSPDCRLDFGRSRRTPLLPGKGDAKKNKFRRQDKKRALLKFMPCHG